MASVQPIHCFFSWRAFDSVYPVMLDRFIAVYDSVSSCGVPENFPVRRIQAGDWVPLGLLLQICLFYRDLFDQLDCFSCRNKINNGYPCDCLLSIDLDCRWTREMISAVHWTLFRWIPDDFSFSVQVFMLLQRESDASRLSCFNAVFRFLIHSSPASHMGISLFSFARRVANLSWKLREAFFVYINS
jgi:hypothetical protein